MGHTVPALNRVTPFEDQSLCARSRATGLVEGSADQAVKELRDHIIEFVRSGRSVKVEGLGTWTPNVTLDGTRDIQYRADTALTNGLNVPGTFTGTILKRENIGRTSDELVNMWNRDSSTVLVE